MDLDHLQLRVATASDAERIAGLHAESWRRFYRGAYSDAFLDGDVVADRLAVWSQRLQEPSAGACTMVAEDDTSLVGFGHVALDDDPTWGALLDNLHVIHREQRAGIGSLLLGEIAAAVIERSGTSGLYLWVLEQNTAAQAFYQARGGTCVEQSPVFASRRGSRPAERETFEATLCMARARFTPPLPVTIPSRD